MPLINLTIYLKENYDYSLKRSVALKTPMHEFVGNNYSDSRLEELYQEVIDIALNKKTGLPYIYEKYREDLEFNLACDEIDDLVKKVCLENAPIASFLLIENPITVETYMTVLIDALIKEQNKTLELFDDIYRDKMSHGQLISKDINRKVRMILNKADFDEYMITEINEDDIIFLEEDMVELLTGRAYA